MFLIDIQDKDPIYIQIQNQIEKFINSGILKTGDKLPSVRQLAQDNGVNPNTVARAYAQLEQNGIVHNIPKKGVYVAEREKKPDDGVRLLIQRIKDTGISNEELMNVINDIYREDDTHVKDK